jgi:pilus assembly protein Flp/PilA
MLALQRLSETARLQSAALTTPRKLLAGCHGGESRPDLGWCAPGINQGGRMSKLMAILRCERGANAIEYALVASLIAIAAVGAFNNMANKIDGMYNNVENHM